MITLFNHVASAHDTSTSAYIDHPAPHSRRQLMRLWLATSETEGGWPLPFQDSKEKRRGGIQVNSNAHTSPLDAE